MKIHLHVFKWLGWAKGDFAWYRCRCGREILDKSADWNLDDTPNIYQIIIK